MRWFYKKMTHNVSHLFMITMMAFLLVACDNKPVETHEVRFYYQQNDIVSVTYNHNDTIEAPEAKPIEGFEFEGWYVNILYEGNPITFDFKVTSDLIYYAKYRDIRPVVTYMVNGEVYDEVRVLNTALLIEPDLNVEGFEVEGWYLDSSFNQKWSFSEDKTDTDINLYAKLNRLAYTITYHYGFDIETESVIRYYEEGLPQVDLPTNPGYSFDGFYLDEALSQPLTITNMPAHDLNLYGKWIPNDYTVNFKLKAYGSFQGIPLSEGEIFIKTELGRNYGATLTNLGRLITWGDNINGQLGTGDTKDSFYVDITGNFNLEPLETIVDFSIGNGHTMVLTSNHRVFTFGSNYHGTLGNASNEDVSTPMDMTSLINIAESDYIVGIKAAIKNSVIWTKDNRVFTWGDNEEGQLGNGTTIDSNTPVEVTGFNLTDTNIKYVELGFDHAALLTENGRLFMWGSNQSGELGDSTNIDKLTPIELTSVFNLDIDDTISEVSLGNNTSGIITNKGRVFTWGMGIFYQLGYTYQDYIYNSNFNSPKEITNRFNLNSSEQITHISMGYTNTLVSTNENRVFGFGKNSFGSLGPLYYGDNIYDPTEIIYNTHGKAVEIAHLDNYFYNNTVTSKEGYIYALGFHYDISENNSNYMGATSSSTPKILNKTIYRYQLDVTYNTLIDLDFTIDGYHIDQWYYSDSYTQPFNVLAPMPHFDLDVYGYIFTLEDIA